ncbi:hypothetical protein SASPL_151688 [Salvia splendens]|uniref:Short-chain dehydrogenase TIC 32, chloroplastic-like n=1 Tax=Salvia splendens TaxID=180675 RepID=A0A8X8Z375_SALSN|nr:hypothetical protein SASPL_151688 [Salvia splendens]
MVLISGFAIYQCYAVRKKMWFFSNKGPFGFYATSTAEQVTQGIDGSGLSAIVTGASSGIGAETARVLALRGVHVIMGVRNVGAGHRSKEAIIKQVPYAKLDAMELDLRHFLLTNLLLETMKKTADKCKHEGRIINVSSRRHKFPYNEGIRFDKINDESGYALKQQKSILYIYCKSVFLGTNSLSAYGQSKLANVLHANELARRLKEENVQITANSLHPGAIATNLFRHYSFLNGLVAALGKHVMKDVHQGAATTCYVALHPDVKGMTGKYYADCNLAETSLQAKDQDLARKLWNFTNNLIDKSTT